MSDQHNEDMEWTDELGESIGYDLEFDWEKLDPAEVDLHDQIIEMTSEDLQALDEKSLTDLQRWALAQAWADFDDDAAFERIALELVHGTRSHQALDYGEIAVEVMNDWLTAGEFEQARAILPLVAELTPEDPHVAQRFLAIMAVLEGEEDEGRERFQELLDQAEEDLELRMMLGLDLFSVGLLDDARGVLEECLEAARSEGYHEMEEEIVMALQQMDELEAEPASEE
jgi:tetratricopeptide (TPR) repeat protein